MAGDNGAVKLFEIVPVTDITDCPEHSDVSLHMKVCAFFYCLFLVHLLAGMIEELYLHFLLKSK